MALDRTWDKRRPCSGRLTLGSGGDGLRDDEEFDYFARIYRSWGDVRHDPSDFVVSAIDAHSCPDEVRDFCGVHVVWCSNRVSTTTLIEFLPAKYSGAPYDGDVDVAHGGDPKFYADRKRTRG
jgi:hypothetical protein